MLKFITAVLTKFLRGETPAGQMPPRQMPIKVVGGYIPASSEHGAPPRGGSAVRKPGSTHRVSQI